MYQIEDVRKDFPILSKTIYNKPLVYLDNAATTQKPLSVIEAMNNEYLNVNSNVHRGVHWLSQQATELHESARETLRKFIKAKSTNDEVIVSEMEHHSNIVPWQLQMARKGIALKVAPIDDEGNLDMEAFKKLFSERTKLVSIAHVSNVLGTVNPIDEIIQFAHSQGVPVLVDGAQSAPHFAIDVQAMDCDFFALSGHKMYGPTGIGVLYGKEEWLDRMPPYQGGGEMIETVSFDKVTFEKPPLKFEAGTPDYVATHGLATAVDYLLDLGMDNIQKHEAMLTKYAMEQLSTIKDIRFIGTPRQKDAVVSFLVGDIHPFDLGTLLDRLGIALRTGHHCAQPLMQRLGIQGTVRASFGLYNTKEEIDVLVKGIERVAAMF